MTSVKQELILDLLSRKDNLTVAEVAEAVHLSTNAAFANLTRLEKAGRVHVSGWSKGAKGRVPNKCYSFGQGISLPYVAANPRPKKPKQDKPPKEDVLDVYIAPNNGWESRIIVQDPRMSHVHHILYMNSFRPQPDIAAAWLFNKPKVELQGARHDLYET